MPGTPRFLTLADVAEVLNTSSAQVYALVRRGDLPAIKIGGRGQWRVESAQLEEYIQRMYAETRDLRRRAPVRGGRASRTQPELTEPTLERSADLGVERDPRPCARSPSRSTVNSQRLAGLVRADRHDQRDAVGDPLAVDLGDHVALLQPARRRPGCRRRPRRSRRRCRRRSPVCTLAPITG